MRAAVIQPAGIAVCPTAPLGLGPVGIEGRFFRCWPGSERYRARGIPTLRIDPAEPEKNFGRQAGHGRFSRSNSRPRMPGTGRGSASSLLRTRASRSSCGSTVTCSVMPAIVTFKTSAVCRHTYTVSVCNLSSSRATLYEPAGATASTPASRNARRKVTCEWLVRVRTALSFQYEEKTVAKTSRRTVIRPPG